MIYGEIAWTALEEELLAKVQPKAIFHGAGRLAAASTVSLGKGIGARFSGAGRLMVGTAISNSPPVIDVGGFFQRTGTFTGTNTHSEVLYTPGPNRVVVLAIHNEGNNYITSSISVAGLTFTRRTYFVWFNYGGGVYNALEVWWAPAVFQQTGVPLTITMSGVVDNASYALFSVANCNINNPFDTNNSLPRVNSDFGPELPVQVPFISTNSTNTLLLSFFGNGLYGADDGTTPAGWTNLFGVYNPGGTNVSELIVDYLTSPLVVSNLSINRSITRSSWGYAADAMAGLVVAGPGLIQTFMVSHQFAGAGALAADATYPPMVSLAGEGMLTVDAEEVELVAAHFTGAGALSSDSHVLVTWHGAAALTGSGVLASDSHVPTQYGQALLAGAGALTADAPARHAAQANLSGIGTLAGDTSSFLRAGYALLAGVGILKASTTWTSVNNGAVLIGAGVLRVDVTRVPIHVTQNVMSVLESGAAVARLRTTQTVLSVMRTADELDGFSGRGVGLLAVNATVIPAGWNAADKSSNITLSNNNATATFTSGSDGAVRGLTSQSTYIYYFEVACGATFAGGDTGIGIANGTASLSGFGAAAANGCAVRPSGEIWNNGVDTGINIGSLAGNTVCGAASFGTGKLWLRNNSGNWNNNGSADPVTGVGGIDISAWAIPNATVVYPIFSGSGAGDNCTITLKAPFTYTVPTGYLAWVTNSPVKLAAAYFNGGDASSSAPLGALAYYSFDDGTATDLTGNGYNGTKTNVNTISGHIGNALTTDTANSGSVIAVAGAGIPIGTTWSASFWSNFPLATFNSNYRTMFRGGNHHVIVDSSGLLGVFAGGFFTSGYNVSGLSGWHMVTAVASGTTTVFYIDAVSVGTSATKPTDNIQYIGNYQGGGQNWGSFDELYVYARALTTLEITALYNIGLPGTFLKADGIVVH